MDILQILLAEYSDGRRKTIYCIAVNLLSLDRVESVMEKVSNHPALDVLPMKDKAAYVVALFEDEASRDGIVLKLRKQPAG